MQVTGNQTGQQRRKDCSIMDPATALVELDVLGMHHAQVSGKRVVPTERLLLGADGTVYLLLAGVVYGVLVACQIVWPREDGVTRLSGRGVDSLALVRPRLRVSLRR